MERGELVVATHGNDTAGSQELPGATGSEHDLTRAFADFLRIDLNVVTQTDIATMFSMVARGEVRLAAGFAITRWRAIANSNLVPSKQRLYPELAVAFDLAKPRQPARAFSRTTDHGRYRQAIKFLEEIERGGALEQMAARHDEPTQHLDYASERAFMQHIAERLPAHRRWFKKAAAEFDVDWRLLAALSYQESLWDPEAVSPTGVRGLMMLTQGTASDLGVEDRSDPQQSVFGGAEYLSIVKQKIPDRIAEPDRTWLALAAYNVGFGHLEDARVLTQGAGGDPDRWTDVRLRLPLLTEPKWFAQTRYGYARGHEPVQYVQNIRNYYVILVGFIDREQSREQARVYPDSSPTL